MKLIHLYNEIDLSTETIVLAKDTAFSNGCIFLVKVPKGTKKGSIIQRLSDGNQMMDLEVIQTDIHSA